MKRTPMARRRVPMKRTGFRRTSAVIVSEDALATIKTTRAIVRAWLLRAVVADICALIGGARRCECPFCPSGQNLATVADTHHVVKRSHFGTKRRAEADSRENLVRLCRRCHAWTDAPAKRIQGRLVITLHGGECFGFSVLRTGRFALLGSVFPVRYHRPSDHPKEVPPCPSDPGSSA